MDPQIQCVLDAFEIADGAARADIETCCMPTAQQPDYWWDLTTAEPDDKPYIDQAMRYLEARGRVIRKPGAPNLVSFTEGA